MIATLRTELQPKATGVGAGLLYTLAIGELDKIDAAVSLGATVAYEATRTLGRLAVREFDEGGPEEQAICQSIMAISAELRRVADLPYWA